MYDEELRAVKLFDRRKKEWRRCEETRQLTMKDICAFMLFLYPSQIGCFPGSSDWGHMQPGLLGDSALQPPGLRQLNCLFSQIRAPS